MENIDKIPFPQADDMNKIFKIINVDKVEDLKNVKYMQIILGDITSRQVQYYLTAVMYLGIISTNKEFTNFGAKIRSLNKYDQMVQVAKLIISKDVFGDVYFSEIILGVKLSRDEVIEIMKKYLMLTSEQMLKRRAQTVIKWIEWINNNDSRR